MDNEEMYKPLPSFLTVDKSEIHGLGIFATKDVANQTNLGLSHVLVDKPNIFVRTPLGGFVKHKLYAFVFYYGYKTYQSWGRINNNISKL